MLAAVLYVGVVLIVIVMVATIGGDGLWSNTITLFNLVVAGLLATNFWEPVVGLLMEKATPRAVYTWDLVVLWLLFAISYSILRVFTDLLSKHRLRLPKPLDIAGGYVMSIWIAWVLVCFTMFTLHTAPLSREFLGGGFTAEQPMIFGLAPDRQWLAFVQKSSLGSLSRMTSDSDPERHVFDRHGDFMLRYATRRDRFAAEEGFLTKE